jgi:hypothetical protein
MSGSRRTGFHITAALRLLCNDMVQRLPELAHIDMDRVAIGFCQTRRNVSHGMYASLTPLRFEGGQLERVVRGTRWRVERLIDQQGQDFLYLLSVYLPRFQNVTLEEKLSTVVHELWHISPRFDGDLRRHAGRCYAHGKSKAAYDAQMDRLAQQWLAADPPPALYEFLEYRFDELAAEHGGVIGDRWPAPKLVPVR